MKLNQTLEKVSELIEKKKILENHINFAEKMKNEIKLRKLEEIYDFEYDLMSNRTLNNEIKKKFNKIITSSNHNQPILSNNDFKYDVLRACLIYYLFNKDMSKDDLASLEKTLTNNFNVKLSSLEYLKQKRAEKKVVSRRYLVKMAKIYGKDEIERGEFSASQGYISRFLSRHSKLIS